ncbi:MAG: Npt1/Npt2 family nucleotide transporter [Bacteroidota bacterium]
MSQKSSVSLFKNRQEVVMLVALNALLGLVSFCYGLARALKDQFTLYYGGPLLISLSKLLVIPSMFFLKFLYDTVNKHTNANGRFYIVTSYFIAFFALFLFIYKTGIIEKLELSWAGRMAQQYKRFETPFTGIQYWPSLLFYIHAEGIGTFMLSVLVWTFINATMSLDQSKRLYTLLSLGAAVSTFFAGYVATMQVSNTILFAVIIACMFCLMLAYYLFYLYKNQYPELFVAVQPKKKKKKLTFVESIKLLITHKESKYLLLITALVLCYTIYVPLVEAFHKSYVKGLGDSLQLRNGVRYFTGVQLRNIGIFSFFTVLILGPLSARSSWFVRAMLTPLVLTLGTISFFITIFYTDSVVALAEKFNLFNRFGILSHLPSGADIASIKSGYVKVSAGMLLVIVGKSFKYIFFDSTKEGAYVPLDSETKVNAKAAIDGAFSRVGKGIGSFYIMIISLIMGTGKDLLGIKYFIIVLLIITLLIWLFSITKLSGMYDAKVAKQASSPSKK